VLLETPDRKQGPDTKALKQKVTWSKVQEKRRSKLGGAVTRGGKMKNKKRGEEAKTKKRNKVARIVEIKT